MRPNSIIHFILLVSAFGLNCEVFAGGKHVHEEAEMSIAIDGKKVSVSLVAPASSIYGFEHEPKDAKEMARREAAVQKMIKEFSNMVAFDAALGCKVKKHNINPFKQEDEEDHGNFEAVFDLECIKNLKGGGAMIKVSSAFPDVKNTDVTIVAEKQSSVVVKKAGARVSF